MWTSVKLSYRWLKVIIFLKKAFCNSVKRHQYFKTWKSKIFGRIFFALLRSWVNFYQVDGLQTLGTWTSEITLQRLKVLNVLWKRQFWTRWSRYQIFKTWKSIFLCNFFALFRPWVSFCVIYGPRTWHVDAWKKAAHVSLDKFVKNNLHAMKRHQLQNLKIQFFLDIFLHFLGPG